MRLFYLLPLAPLLCAISCKPVLETSAGTVFHPPLSPRSECVVLGLSDTIAIHEDSICRLTYAQTLSSTPWSPEEIARYFQVEARHNGGNLVKVKRYGWGDANGDRMVVAATVYRVSDIRHYEKQIEWTPNRKLRLSDFKGPPDVEPDGRPILHSYSGCDFYLFSRAKFYCYYGWIDPASPDSLRLLQHEQGNFDLSEIYRRQLDEDVIRNEQHVGNQYKMTEHVFREVYAAYLAKQAEYEQCTDHGLDPVRQAEWTKRIGVELANGPGRHDPFFAVDPDFIRRQKDSLVSALRPLPGKALVYIIRPKNISTPVPTRVLYDPLFLMLGAPYGYFINGNVYTVGYKDSTTDPIHQQTFIYRNVDPDLYTFTAVMNRGSEHVHGFADRHYKKGPGVQLSVVAGKTYYFQLKTGDTWFGYAPPQLELLTDREGRELVLKCSLATTGDDMELPELSNPLE